MFGRRTEHPGQAPIFLLLDALDECPNSSTMLSARESVLMFVKELMDSHLPNLRICVAIRTEIDIKAVLEPLAAHSVSIHDESGKIEDIENHIKVRCQHRSKNPKVEKGGQATGD
jgi:hypothetical protein